MIDGGDAEMGKNVKIPIKVGTQARYNAIQHEPTIIYVCSDSGNMYLGNKPIGGSTNVLFYAYENIPADFGDSGQQCITPYGIFEKDEETSSWKLFSRWSITSNGELAIDGTVPVATATKLGFVKSSDADGDISVREDGTMSVNGWDSIEASSNFIYRSE